MSHDTEKLHGPVFGTARTVAEVMENARRRVGLSSYHRMKQRAEIAEAEERRLGAEVRRLQGIVVVRAMSDTVIAACGGADEVSWFRDVWTVVGGVLLAAGLIAVIVWGIYG